jgi:uncharacterized circularly permuted ATP-grasp superfamily protein/uncharacterized alpha-E superfamily protein
MTGANGEFRVPAERHDEAFSADGSVRPHWRYLLSSLEGLGQQGIAERHNKAQRILRDDGATYNVYGDPQNSRTWALDPVPLLLDSTEWATIEAGLLERAELLDLTLKDLYGPRDLIRYGVVPPEVVFSHPGFLRACQGIRLRGEHQLILHACDMVRAADGSMVVMSDRTQAPSGAGYALENRTVMSRVLPSVFRDSHVHRLALFFQSLRNKLSELAPTDSLPRIVVLTPGAYSETFFEHAYLANYLGYSLVQGGDLTVRGDSVWMKSLNGLSRVDVILRRVDDFYCDPVELKADSHLGVPGLLEAARAGRVAIANSLGSGVLENPALLKYINAIGRHFLGRKPRIPSATTYWCGDDDDYRFVMKNLERLVIKPSFRRPGWNSVRLDELRGEARDRLLRRMREDRLHFVAQESLAASRSPTLVNGELLGRPSVLRSFAVASESSYTIMPGGLTRVGLTDETLIVTNQRGSVSKDTWVIASEPEKQVSLHEAGRARQARTAQPGELPSRIIENMFWLGRYAERAECAMRYLRTVFVQLNANDALPVTLQRRLLQGVTSLTSTYPGFVSADAALLESPEAELLAVILDRSRPGSVAACLNAMLTAADETKERLSADTQRIVNDIRDQLWTLEETLRNGLGAAPEESLDPLVTSLLAFAGLAQESMVRGFGWRFLEMGRRIERALQTISLLRSLLGTASDPDAQDGLLESALLSVEMLITYRRRFRGELDVGNALLTLLLDQGNPRSLLYQLAKLREHVDELPVREMHTGLSEECRSVIEAYSLLQLSRVEDLAEVDAESAQRLRLDQLLARVQHLLSLTADQVSQRYFDHTKGPQQLGGFAWRQE